MKLAPKTRKPNTQPSSKSPTSRKQKPSRPKKPKQPSPVKRGRTRPRVNLVNPNSTAFGQWMAELGPAPRGKATTKLLAATAPARARSLGATTTRSAAWLDYVHAYRNEREPKVDGNTCGQAAIATLLDFFGKDPFRLTREKFDTTDNKKYWDEGKAIDAVKASGFGPDAFGGLFGTSPSQIQAALSHFGLKAKIVFPPTFPSLNGRATAWANLQAYLGKGKPAAVLVGTAPIGGPTFGLHWAIVYRVESHSNEIPLGNWQQKPFPVEVFLNAWQCALPIPRADYHYCAIQIED
jgi:hypothetical protein